MKYLNPLRTPVLITSDEVLFHAPIQGEADPRQIFNSIIVAERRFIKPLLGDKLYADLCNAKNKVITEANKAELLAELNNARPGIRNPITGSNVLVGDMVNSPDYLDARGQELWHHYLHKIIAECVYFVALPTNRARFTAQGVEVNNPNNLAGGGATAAVDLKDLKHLMDTVLQQRIQPLLDDMHGWLCRSSYPGYTGDCGCGEEVKQGKRSSVILGMYDDDEDDCRCNRRY